MKNEIKNEKEKIINYYIDNPNLKFRKSLYINDKSFEGFSLNRFDYFILNKIIYIAVPNVFCFNSNPLSIYKLNKFFNLEKILSLEGHKSQIILVKNFFDKKNNKNFLLTSDTFPLVLIWEIENENSIIIKFTISIYYLGEILSALILFEPKNKIILTSNVKSLNSCEFSLSSGNFIRYIEGTNNETYYILDYKDYIIELCLDKIYFYNISNKNETYTIKNEHTKDKNIYGYINEYILFVNNFSNGKILIINLNNKTIINTINTNQSENLFSLICWNKNYLIGTDIKNQCLYIIDTLQMIIINKIKTKINPMYIKKINLSRDLYQIDTILLILDNKLAFEIWIRRNCI